MKEVLQTLRLLLSEVRKASANGTFRESLLTKHIISQYRKYMVTDQQLCKAQEEMKFLSESYLCYLRSQRQFRELRNLYQGKGEYSIKETADLVGFKLPHDPK